MSRQSSWRRSRSGPGRVFLLPAVLLMALGSPAGWPQEEPRVLRVGVVDGAPPCSLRQDGAWKGLAVDLWSRVAMEEQIPFTLEDRSTLRSRLEATRRNDVDVAVGCINLSPERRAVA